MSNHCYNNNWPYVQVTTLKKDEFYGPIYTPASLLLLGFLSSLGDLPCLLFLLNTLDDTNGNRLLHVTHSKSPKRWVLGEGFHTHRLGWDKLNNSSVAALHGLRVVLEFLATSTVALLYQLSKLAGNVGRVAVQHRGIAGMDLARVVKDDHLFERREERGGREKNGGRDGKRVETYALKLHERRGWLPEQ